MSQAGLLMQQNEYSARRLLSQDRTTPTRTATVTTRDVAQRAGRGRGLFRAVPRY